MIKTQSRPTPAVPMSPTMSPSSFACSHIPACPTADALDRDAAHTVSAHPEQGWSLLCNGVVVFDDLGELLPNGECIGERHDWLLSCSPHRTCA